MKNKKLIIIGVVAIGGYLLWRKYGKKANGGSSTAVPLPRPTYQGGTSPDGKGEPLTTKPFEVVSDPILDGTRVR